MKITDIIEERDKIKEELEEYRDIIEILNYELQDIEEELEKHRLRIV